MTKNYVRFTFNFPLQEWSFDRTHIWKLLYIYNWNAFQCYFMFWSVLWIHWRQFTNIKWMNLIPVENWLQLRMFQRIFPIIPRINLFSLQIFLCRSSFRVPKLGCSWIESTSWMPYLNKWRILRCNPYFKNNVKCQNRY